MEQSEEIKPPNKLKRFFIETGRVIRVLKKPSKEEYFTLVKVTGLGITIIGIMGFLIFIIKQIFV